VNVGVGLVVLVLVFAVVYVSRRPTSSLRARVLRRSAFGLMAVFAVLFGAFVVGETMSDPGGWVGAGLVALWLVPLGVAAVVAWRWPAIATLVLAGVVAAALAMSVWYALEPDEWNAFEDRTGPVRTIAVFAASACVAVLGLKRPAAAGWMLVVLGAAPIAISTLGSGLGLPALAIASSPTFASGVLYIIASVLDGPAGSPSATDHPGTQPRAA
jgi:hypothetical protein